MADATAGGNWLDDEKVQEKVRAMRRPPFDFQIPRHLEDSINGLIKCLEDKRHMSLDVWEDDVYTGARGNSQEAWIQSYYSDGGWMGDD
jgi:hypothetical protein